MDVETKARQLGDGAEGETLLSFIEARKRLLKAEDEWIIAGCTSSGVVSDAYAAADRDHAKWRRRLHELNNGKEHI
jgi:hypothetical protein